MTGASDSRKLVFVGGEPDVAYELESLLHASAEVLGKGWLGTTYRATLEGGVAVVTVKRLRELPIPEKEFRGTVAALGALRHDNLVPLRSYFYSKEEKLIVYDFVKAKGLSSLLHLPNGAASLDFAARARIARGCARGVAFIHGAGSSHGNIKSSNVLVTDARDGAYMTDYGLVQLVGAGVPLKRVTGYRAPEVTDPRRASQEADVYSFGVLLLELLTGRAPANSVPGSDGAADLPQWVRTVVQEEWTGEVFDAAIANETPVEEEMVRLLQLATDCTEHRPDGRPAMADVAARIEDIVGSAQRKAADSDEFHSVSADHSSPPP
jgi:serine/threonine protein kinase